MIIQDLYVAFEYIPFDLINILRRGTEIETTENGLLYMEFQRRVRARIEDPTDKLVEPPLEILELCNGIPQMTRRFSRMWNKRVDYWEAATGELVPKPKKSRPSKAADVAPEVPQQETESTLQILEPAGEIPSPIDVLPVNICADQGASSQCVFSEIVLASMAKDVLALSRLSPPASGTIHDDNDQASFIPCLYSSNGHSTTIDLGIKPATSPTPIAVTTEDDCMWRPDSPDVGESIVVDELGRAEEDLRIASASVSVRARSSTLSSSNPRDTTPDRLCTVSDTVGSSPAVPMEISDDDDHEEIVSMVEPHPAKPVTVLPRAQKRVRIKLRARS